MREIVMIRYTFDIIRGCIRCFSGVRPIASVLFLGFFTFAVLAQGGPPMITDDTETVPKHHFEINTGFTMERGRDGSIYSVPDIDFNYGLNKRMQLRIETPWVLCS
jgi:hypothetical protein